MGGDYNWEGRVEIFYSGKWSTISDISWTSSDATVVCIQLRHSTSTTGELYFELALKYTSPCTLIDKSGADERQRCEGACNYGTVRILIHYIFPVITSLCICVLLAAAHNN